MHPPDVDGLTAARRVLGARAAAHSRRGPVAAVAGAVSARRRRQVLPQDAAWHRRPWRVRARRPAAALRRDLPQDSAADGSPQSQQDLHQRVCYHYTGNAEGSTSDAPTLRLTLGSLLASELGIELRRVGSSRRRCPRRALAARRHRRATRRRACAPSNRSRALWSGRRRRDRAPTPRPAARSAMPCL